MRSKTAIAIAVLAAAWVGAITARLIYPEILPVLDVLTIVFYLMIAVTLIAVMRNMIGLVTYGVFGPAIISIGLNRIGSLYWGLIAVAAVLGVGILMRFALEPLKLQMTHRLAIVVTTLSFTIGVIALVAAKTGNVSLSYIDFIPILISSWIAERFVRDRQESGVGVSLQRLANTLVAVVVSFLLLSWHPIVDSFIHTPELWIVPIAVNLLLGSSVRIRLSERLRFKGIAEPSSSWGDYSKILTLNLRGMDYIEKYNPRAVYQSITKLSMKNLLSKLGLPVPAVFATFSSIEDVRNLERVLDRLPKDRGFALKPDNGFGGRGILVVKRWDTQGFEKTDGSRITWGDLRKHIQEIVDGEFSGRWLPDKAFLEELVTPHPDIARLSVSGLPDVRVIVFRGVPVMAMSRLPTKRSGGKANLFQGAVGAGVNVKTGKVESAVVGHKRKSIRRHPDTNLELVGQKIPFWQEILDLSVKAQMASGLGYAGVDIVLSDARGPLIMEVNKRPGLEIQNANRRPLLVRLRAVESSLDEGVELSVDEGIELMKRLESVNWIIRKARPNKKGGAML